MTHGMTLSSNVCAIDLRQDMINCVGGLPVLFPILEQLAFMTTDQQMNDPAVGSDFITPDGTTPADGDWVILPSNRASGLLRCNCQYNLCYNLYYETKARHKQHKEINGYAFFVSEARLEKNLVATFLLVLKHFLQRHPINQENLLYSHGAATLGALLQKVSV